MEPFIGEIKLFAGNFAPRGFAFCSGQLLAISQNQALFSILGTTYGGDGRTTFGLPDLRGRVAMGPGQGAGLSNYALGQKGGAEQVTLNANQIPAHSHDLHANTQAATTNAPAGAALANTRGRDWDYDSSGNVNTTLSDKSIGTSGGGQAHENRQPYLAVHYIIALQGIYPSRS